MHGRADGNQQKINGCLYGRPHTDDGERVVQPDKKISYDGVQDEAEKTSAPRWNT